MIPRFEVEIDKLSVLVSIKQGKILCSHTKDLRLAAVGHLMAMGLIDYVNGEWIDANEID